MVKRSKDEPSFLSLCVSWFSVSPERERERERERREESEYSEKPEK